MESSNGMRDRNAMELSDETHDRNITESSDEKHKSGGVHDRIER